METASIIRGSCLESAYEGNIILHRVEARFYDLIHQEVWNKAEQKRLWASLKNAISHIQSGGFAALDFGSGTGNIAEKLLGLGFEVLAVDISPEMCVALRKKCSNKKLHILCTNIDEDEINKQFDLVACSSVLHHLPDYKKTLKKLIKQVKVGGIIYIDHESPANQKRKFNFAEFLLLFLYGKVTEVCQKLYLHGVKTPHLDYTKADINPNLDYHALLGILWEEGFKILKCEDYYSQETWFQTPFSSLHRLIKGPNSILIVAKRMEAVK